MLKAYFPDAATVSCVLNPVPGSTALTPFAPAVFSKYMSEMPVPLEIVWSTTE